MKKKVKQYAYQIEIGALERRQVLKDFSKMLDNQVWYIYVLTNFFFWHCLYLSNCIDFLQDLGRNILWALGAFSFDFLIFTRIEL